MENLNDIKCEGFLIFISISFASAGGGATGAAFPLLPPPARVNGFSAITVASAASGS